MLDLHGYGPSIFVGAILTIEVAFLSLAVALALGMLAAVARLSKNKFANAIAVAYTTVIRGVPDLVLMLLIFFGAQIMMNNLSDWLYDTFEVDYYININEFVAGVTTIGFIFGAYMAETFRGAFLAVDNGQIEAGRAYGMSSMQVFRRITVPQMMRHAIPGIGNNWLVLVKTTALVSVIGLADMVRLAKEAAGAVHEPFLFFIPVAFVYLALTSVSEIILKRLEIRFSAGTVRS
ncbi:ABC transporter permease [Agarivorans gilvus]|jgi:arginine/ornithine transport system permease protein|uniref:Histidine/lysine/arginine/ornithine ABC transporter permease HisQ n=1 Tax=Agarivorans gilvus TaxID=680279 RepID=A0ABQ1I2A2_9ALTE|nr:ABC transporter permease [Agarivorans gilvus]GGB09652.1 histidine/lysine/arginine/ornithine ABC transporter permease HisQ [Agarivorans gilvus]